MSEPTIKLAVAPCLRLRVPLCDVCSVEVEDGGDGYECPTCFTSWEYGVGEDEPGTLFEDWSGETLDLPLTDPADAWLTTIDADRARRKAEQARARAAYIERTTP